MEIKKRYILLLVLGAIFNNGAFAQIEVESDGNVLVGNPLNTSPTYTKGLNVYGNIYAPTTSGNESSLIGFKNIIGRSGDGILHLQGGMAGANGGLVLINHSHNGNIIMATGGGKVRIGNLFQNGRTDKLFVDGTVGATQYWEGNTRLSAKGSQKKYDIEALTTINSLESYLSPSSKSSGGSPDGGYGFNMNDKMLSEVPYAFKNDGEGGYQINYHALIPLLVEGIKELNGKIDELEELKSEIEDLKGNISQSETSSVLSSKKIELFQNVPNPYSKSTRIKYYLNEKIESARLIIYDLQGSQKRNVEITGRGNGSIEIQGGTLASGIYPYLIIYDDNVSDSKKMILLD